MRAARRLRPLFTAALTSPRTRDARRALHEFARRPRGAPHRVHCFHQVDDPYGQLVAQILPAFVARYAIELDTRREALRLGVPFGRVQDPVGRAVLRGGSLFPRAREQGRGGELLVALARAAFAQGVEIARRSS